MTWNTGKHLDNGNSFCLKMNNMRNGQSRLNQIISNIKTRIHFMSNMEFWNAVKRPPTSALKQIKGGRLRGMTDISPQWRYQVLTEQLGRCGEGWGFDIVKVWNEVHGNETLAFAEISLWLGNKDNRIPGIGGSKLVAVESSGPHISDEAYKMAVTDAISVAAKMAGVGADIYMGLFDGSKYKESKIEASHIGSDNASRIIKPSSGVWESLDELTREKLGREATTIEEYLEQGDSLSAARHLQELGLDTEQKIGIWTLFDSKQRSALTKAIAELT